MGTVWDKWFMAPPSFEFSIFYPHFPALSSVTAKIMDSAKLKRKKEDNFVLFSNFLYDIIRKKQKSGAITILCAITTMSHRFNYLHFIAKYGIIL